MDGERRVVRSPVGRGLYVVTLDDDQRARVRRKVVEDLLVCPGCGGLGVEVGAAAFAGYRWDEMRGDAYEVALTCASPGCPEPTSRIGMYAASWCRDSSAI